MKIIKQIALSPLLLASCLIQGMESTHPIPASLGLSGGFSGGFSGGIEYSKASSGLSPEVSAYELFSGIESLPLSKQMERIAKWLETIQKHEYLVYKEISMKEFSAVALSADGKTALTEDYNNGAVLWNAETAEQIKVLGGNIKNYSWLVRLALSADGTIALTVLRNGTAIVWNTKTGKKLQEFSYTDRVYSVALSADGKTALTELADRKVILWDTETGKHLKELQSFVKDIRIRSLALSDGGEIALIALNDMSNSVIVWNTKTGERKILEGGAETLLVLSADGKTALAADSQNEIILWNTETGKKILVLEDHKDHISSVALSPDGKTALTGSHDQTAILWDTATGKKIKKFRVDERVISVALGLDKIAIGLQDKIIFLKPSEWTEERKNDAYEILL